MTDSANEKQDNMIACHVCGHKNLIGTLLCDNCGAMLSADGRSQYGTRNLTDVLPEFQDSSVFTTSGTGDFKDGMRLVLEIVEQKEKMEFDPSRRNLVVGRRDPVSRRKPDIDLEDYEGYRNGVSRRHALFILDGEMLSIQDYGSANGTFLNGVRLPAHQAHMVHDGDVVRLGRLNVRLYFVIDEKRKDS